MATKVHMEALSPTMEEGQLVRWLKQEGDQVAEGDVLAEIETDKATMELVARGAGVLRKQLLPEGASAPVGAVIGVVAGADEDISSILAEAPTSAGQPAHGGESEAAPELAAAAAVSAAGESERDEAAAGVQAAVQAPSRPATPTPPSAPAGRASTPASGGEATGNGAERGGRVKASPLARRLAAEAGLELNSVRGTGPGGRITKRDIEGARERAPQRGAAAPAAAAARGAAPAAAAAPALREASERPEVEEVPVSQMRKTIAKRLVTSIGPVPTFYLTVEVDMGHMSEARARINDRLAASGQKVSINDLLIRATAEALRRHPEVNAAWGETVIRRYGRVHIGMAVAVEDGLITPVIRDADRKGVAQIAREARELAARARDRKLTPEEYTGATFSISNLGMLDIDEFTAIINPPEAAILAVGRVEEKPVVVDGQVVPGKRMRMTMSCDHRVVNGATGARFLQTLRAFLEEPTMMLV